MVASPSHPAWILQNYNKCTTTSKTCSHLLVKLGKMGRYTIFSNKPDPKKILHRGTLREGEKNVSIRAQGLKTGHFGSQS